MNHPGEKSLTLECRCVYPGTIRSITLFRITNFLTFAPCAFGHFPLSDRLLIPQTVILLQLWQLLQVLQLLLLLQLLQFGEYIMSSWSGLCYVIFHLISWQAPLSDQHTQIATGPSIPLMMLPKWGLNTRLPVKGPNRHRSRERTSQFHSHAAITVEGLSIECTTRSSMSYRVEGVPPVQLGRRTVRRNMTLTNLPALWSVWAPAPPFLVSFYILWVLA